MSNCVGIFDPLYHSAPRHANVKALRNYFPSKSTWHTHVWSPRRYLTTRSILFLIVEGRSPSGSVVKVQLRFYLLGPLAGHVPTWERVRTSSRAHPGWAMDESWSSSYSPASVCSRVNRTVGQLGKTKRVLARARLLFKRGDTRLFQVTFLIGLRKAEIKLTGPTHTHNKTICPFYCFSHYQFK